MIKPSLRDIAIAVRQGISNSPTDSSRLIKSLFDWLKSRRLFNRLPEILAIIRQLEAEDRGRQLVRMVVPSAFDDDKVAVELSTLSGNEYELEIEHSDALVGGAILYRGDWRIDNSVQGRLRRVADSLAINRRD